MLTSNITDFKATSGHCRSNVTDFVCCRLQHRRRKKIAEDACELTDEVKEQFRAMTADRDELQAQIDDLHRQAAAIQCANPRVMQARKHLNLYPSHLTCRCAGTGVTMIVANAGVSGGCPDQRGWAKIRFMQIHSRSTCHFTDLGIKANWYPLWYLKWSDGESLEQRHLCVWKQWPISEPRQAVWH